ncbi:hypothetical protein [Paenarthrobacter sp. NPDC058040]|uniref:hypothetical protein n=1 Tax=unclassified Paenarthrobacter TaxID=2634190 RepID=UPI0036DD02B6
MPTTSAVVENTHRRSQLPRSQKRITWPEISAGDAVEVITRGRILLGTVDCIMPDGSIFWLWQNDGSGRTAVHEVDKPAVYVRIAVTPAEEQEDGARRSSRARPIRRAAQGT